jgi:hypothetical protein
MYVVLSPTNVLVSCFSDLQSIGLYCISPQADKNEVLHLELSPVKIFCFVLADLWRSDRFTGAQKWLNTIDVSTVNGADRDNVWMI